MTSLSTLSDAPQYRIKEVSAQTGIPTVTIRAWERRYEVLTPHRAENTYRLYSARDVAILRWLKSRVEGEERVAISAAVSELRELVQRGGPLPEVETPAKPKPPARPALSPAKYARELFLALTRHDEAAAGEILEETLAGLDLQTVITQVITPCLVEIGEGWSRGYIRVTTEHFASAFLRGRLLALLLALPTRRGAPLVLVGGAPSEEHEIGALMLALLLRSGGFRVEFLGADVPLDDLVDHARFEKPALIILTATTRPAALELAPLQAKLNRLRPAPLFGYGGAAFNLEPGLRAQVPGIFLGESLALALGKVGELVGKKK